MFPHRGQETPLHAASRVVAKYDLDANSGPEHSSTETSSEVGGGTSRAEVHYLALRAGELSITVVLSPFAPRKPRSFAERR